MVEWRSGIHRTSAISRITFETKIEFSSVIVTLCTLSVFVKMSMKIFAVLTAVRLNIVYAKAYLTNTSMIVMIFS